MITILGATGNVGGKIADILIKQGKAVRLVARSADHLKPYVGKSASAFAGDIKNTAFLAKAFMNVDAVFTLIPPDPIADNFMRHAGTVSESIARALEIAEVRTVVNLSSIGAELSAGAGPVKGLHFQEERLNTIKGLNVLHLRAAYFMENALGNIGLIKSQGITGGALRGDLAIPMIATRDIAAFAAEHLVKRDFSGSSIQYLLGQRDLTMTEASEIIGKKIGKTGMPYVQFSYGDAEKAMISMGLSPDMSRNYIEMIKAFNDGLIKGEVRTARKTTPTSFEAFCDEVFVPQYSLKNAA